MEPTIHIAIDKNVPMPGKFIFPNSTLAKIRATLLAMEPGDSFLWKDHKGPFDAAKQLGFKVTTRKENAKGVRVWLIHKNGKPCKLNSKTVSE